MVSVDKLTKFMYMKNEFGLLPRLFSRIFTDKYSSSRLVLIIDVLITAVSAMTIYYVVSLLTQMVIPRMAMMLWVFGSVMVGGALYAFMGVNRIVVRHSSILDVGRMASATGLKNVILGLVLTCVPWKTIPLQITGALLLGDFLLCTMLIVTARASMVAAYVYLRRAVSAHGGGRHRVLIFGTNDKAVSLTQRLSGSPHYEVAGFLVQGKRPAGSDLLIHGLPVRYYRSVEDITRIKADLQIDDVLFTYYLPARQDHADMIHFCQKNDLGMLIAPGIDEAGVVGQSIRKVRIEDLLGREEIKVSENRIMESLGGCTVLVTGAAGSIGSELCRQLSRFGVRRIIAYDNAETPLNDIKLEFDDGHPEVEFIPVIGDVRLEPRLDYVFRNYRPDVVFHAAAYKHVPLMEENPCEAVLVNVLGSRQVAEKSLQYNVSRMVMVSTDKAVNPTNVMGCTKRLAEIYVQSLGLAIAKGEVAGHTRFITTRFGNVLGSNGSVVPRFREQIENGGPVTVTHPEIRRFFMTIPEACRLVMEAATISNGNEIFVFDMGDAVRISYLAEQMIALSGLRPGVDIEIKYTGLRPGEKLYEEVLATEENTSPTTHGRIRIATVREYPYKEALAVMHKLEDLAGAVEIDDMVRLMKKTVPEFISRHSRFEAIDAELAQERANGVMEKAATLN